VTQKKIYEIAAHLFVLIKRQVNQAEISFGLCDGRRVKLSFVIEERPQLFICHDKDSADDFAKTP
jgi:hypothetical protein